MLYFKGHVFSSIFYNGDNPYPDNFLGLGQLSSWVSLEHFDHWTIQTLTCCNIRISNWTLDQIKKSVEICYSLHFKEIHMGIFLPPYQRRNKLLQCRQFYQFETTIIYHCVSSSFVCGIVPSLCTVDTMTILSQANPKVLLEYEMMLMINLIYTANV